MFTIRGCSPKRGEICSCRHVPELECTDNKTVWQGHFPQVFFLFIFYDFFYFYTDPVHVFLIVYHSSSTHSSKLTGQISLAFGFA